MHGRQTYRLQTSHTFLIVIIRRNIYHVQGALVPLNPLRGCESLLKNEHEIRNSNREV